MADGADTPVDSGAAQRRVLVGVSRRHRHLQGGRVRARAAPRTASQPHRRRHRGDASGSSCRSRSPPSPRRRSSTTTAPGRPAAAGSSTSRRPVRRDVMVVAPATANTIAKMAAGIADNLLTTIYLAFRGPVIVAPTMNWAMYEHAATQQNLAVLRERGVEVLPTGEGDLACGEEGGGRMAEPEAILSAVQPRLRRAAAGPLRGTSRRGHRRRHARGDRRRALHRQPLQRQDGPRDRRRGLPARRRRHARHHPAGATARRTTSCVVESAAEMAAAVDERSRDGRRPRHGRGRRRLPSAGDRRGQDRARRARDAHARARAHRRHPRRRRASGAARASGSPPRPGRASTGRAPRRRPRASTCSSSTTSSPPGSASAPTRTRSPSSRADGEIHVPRTSKAACARRDPRPDRARRLRGAAEPRDDCAATQRPLDGPRSEAAHRQREPRRHMLATEAIMRAVAARLGEDPDVWGLAGLAHDLDAEETAGDFTRHGAEAAATLREPRAARGGRSRRRGAQSGDRRRGRVDARHRPHRRRPGHRADHRGDARASRQATSPASSSSRCASACARAPSRAASTATSIARCEELGLELDEFLALGLKAMQGIAADLGL